MTDAPRGFLRRTRTFSVRLFAGSGLLSAPGPTGVGAERVMLETKTLFDVPRHPGRMRLGPGVLWAMRHAVAARGTAGSMLITIVVSLPLFAVGYHEAAWPIVGYWLALGLGAVAAGACMGVMVAGLIGAPRKLAWQGVACQVGAMAPFTWTFGAVGTGIILAWRHLFGSASEVEWLTSWYANEWTGAWKPLAQVTALGVMHIAIAPFAALAVPALAVTSGSSAQTVAWIRHKLHHKAYDAFGIAYWGLLLAALAHVPWMGLLALPVMCLLMVRVFHFSLSPREGVAVSATGELT